MDDFIKDNSVSTDEQNDSGININSNNGKNISEQGFTNYHREIPKLPDVSAVFSNENEVSYYPEGEHKPSKKNRKKIFKTIIAVACVFAISFISVGGYVIFTNNGRDLPFHSSEDSSSSLTESSFTDETPKSVNAEGLPSLMQLAARENALSVPNIVIKVSPSVVGISSEVSGGTATGTGIIMSDDGYIITNCHVVEDALGITVVISVGDDFEEYEAALVGLDSQTDLAVLKIDKTGLTAAEFGLSSNLLVGELAIAIGNPLGFELSGSVTGGIISALNRELTVDEKQMTLIQTDAAINPGNSGGPLVNSFGQVIGINSVKIASTFSTSIDGIGFAIPIDDAKPIIDDLIQYGFVKSRPTLGISGEDVTSVISRYYDIPQGFLVRYVDPESGASDAGILIGDIVTAINDKAISSAAELNAAKSKYKAGDTVKLAIYRDGVDLEVDVVLAEAKAKG